MCEVLVEAKDLVKEFRINKKTALTAVNHVSFCIYRGEKFGVVGESGCGKSTLGRVLLQLYDATSGSVIYHGKALGHLGVSAADGVDLCTLDKAQMREIRYDMQMIFQDPAASLDPRQTVGKAIEEPLVINTDMDAARRKERALQLLDRVGLKAEHYDVYPHNLSGGQKQRVGIARAIPLHPSFIVLDEAVSALDVSVKAQILQLLNQLSTEEQLTYFFITHDLGVAKHFCDRIMVMYLGTVCELAPSKELFAHRLHPYTESLLDSVPRMRFGAGRHETEILQGEVPSPIHPPEGCPFHTRCKHCMEVCRHEKPACRELEPDHFVACHLYDEK